MLRLMSGVLTPLAVLVVATVPFLAATPAPPDQASPVATATVANAAGKTITAADCTAERLGSLVAPSAIGEPVRSVTLSAPSWVGVREWRAGTLPRERIDGADRYRHHRQANQFRRGAAGVVGRGVRRSLAAEG